jgi:hypothetical protein
VQQRTLLVMGDQDLLIPSAAEGPRLQRLLPRAHLRVEKGRSHALLQEGGVDLVSILDEEGFYERRRRLSAPVKKRFETGTKPGSAAPIELPTEKELARYGEGTTRLSRRLTSPVFFSTTDSGVVTRGLGGIPEGRPILFVGNHQTLALDLGVLCEEFLKERDVMLRGLAHPVIFANTVGGNGSGSSSSYKDGDSNGNGNGVGEKSSSNGGLAPWDVIPAITAALGREGGGGDSSAFADFMTTFGAVPVSGFALHRLLAGGEAVLLFPGGVREAYRRKGEEYKLFWPEKSGEKQKRFVMFS